MADIEFHVQIFIKEANKRHQPPATCQKLASFYILCPPNQEIYTRLVHKISPSSTETSLGVHESMIEWLRHNPAINPLISEVVVLLGLESLSTAIPSYK